MGDQNNSTINNGSNSSPESMTTSSKIWSRDNRSANIWTHEVGNKWTIGVGGKIKLSDSGSDFRQWNIPNTDSDTNTPSTLYMFGSPRILENGEISTREYQFVRSNSNQDGLELSSPTPSPTGNTFNSEDLKAFHFTRSDQSSDATKILCHCATNKFVSFDTESDGLVLQTEKENAHECDVDC